MYLLRIVCHNAIITTSNVYYYYETRRIKNKVLITQENFKTTWHYKLSIYLSDLILPTENYYNLCHFYEHIIGEITFISIEDNLSLMMGFFIQMVQ